MFHNRYSHFLGISISYKFLIPWNLLQLDLCCKDALLYKKTEMKSEPIKFKHLLNNSFVKQYVLKEYMRGIRNDLQNLSVASRE